MKIYRVGVITPVKKNLIGVGLLPILYRVNMTREQTKTSRLANVKFYHIFIFLCNKKHPCLLLVSMGRGVNWYNVNSVNYTCAVDRTG